MGQLLAGYRITWIGAIRHDGVVPVRLRKGNAELRLIVARKGGNARPPAVSDQYAVYYEHVPTGTSGPDQDAMATCEALAKWLTKTEKGAAPLSGLKVLGAPGKSL